MENEERVFNKLFDVVERTVNEYTQLQGKLKGHFDLQNKDIKDILEDIERLKALQEAIIKYLKQINKNVTTTTVQNLLENREEGHLKWYLLKIHEEVTKQKKRTETLLLKLIVIGGAIVGGLTGLGWFLK